ncbi:MAG: polyketide cyclase / dehydrase and lipid transport [uncultured archaeon A07HB70]|nr:MAG: polyketide cyclase / dehydrase and lipid transport [uncultured archaeon A07HB70]
MDVERTPEGRRLVVARSFARPPADVWDRLVDTAAWPEWGPSVAAVDCDERRIGSGTTGRVRVARLGVWLPFEVTACEWDGERGRWAWRVARIPATGHRVAPVDGGCRAAFELPPAAAPYAAVCRRALGRL